VAASNIEVKLDVKILVVCLLVVDISKLGVAQLNGGERHKLVGRDGPMG
jgi:hypothetical protein